jgi:hypothetical protein
VLEGQQKDARIAEGMPRQIEGARSPTERLKHGGTLTIVVTIAVVTIAVVVIVIAILGIVIGVANPPWGFSLPGLLRPVTRIARRPAMRLTGLGARTGRAAPSPQCLGSARALTPHPRPRRGSV